MASATTTARSTAVSRIGSWLPLACAGVAALASIVAAISGGTGARATVAIAFPVAVGAWIQRSTNSRPHSLMLAVLGLLGVAGSLHVAFTSPTAAWVVDSHMAPPVLSALLPGGTTRIAVAWTVPVLWAATFIAVALVHRRVGSPVGAVVLLGVGTAPLLFGNAFPTDAYRLLWDSSALGHSAYAAGACAVFLVMMRTHDRTTRGPAETSGLS